MSDEIFNRDAQLVVARERLAATGKSPRQIGREASQKVLLWLYCWGYSSSDLIQRLLNRTSGGYAKKLVRKGLLVETRTRSGVPAKIYTLSKSGLQEAARNAEVLYQYPEIDPFKISQQLIRHNLLAQAITLTDIEYGETERFETERMFSEKGDEKGIKRPDVVWITAKGERVGIEVELTPKWDRDLDEFVLNIGRALVGTENAPARFDRFEIYSDSQAILKRYRDAMAPDARINSWIKNERNHWVIRKTQKVPDWLIEKVSFYGLAT